MEVFNNPKRQEWPALCQRPLLQNAQLTDTVNEIMATVEAEGDTAVYDLTETLDGVRLESLTVSDEDIEQAIAQVPDDLKAAIDLAYANIYTYHKAQELSATPIETSPGVTCWSKSVPIGKVGLYIPGGTAPLFSTVLMLGIPAMIASCPEIVLCSPPNKDGRLAPAVIYAANRIGIRSIFKVGGAQAIAAMTVGTESIPAVYKLFGPGNQYVTKSKELAQMQGVAIDMPAGPSEVLVVADKTSNPAFVAADLLSQAEHGPDSQVMLVSDSAQIVAECMRALENQINALPRKDVAQQAIDNSKAFVFGDLEEGMRFSNAYAPEHLIIATEHAEQLGALVTNAGSVFLGNYSCESAGDYASGTNHTLPTNGYARNYSGVSLSSFMKTISYQKLTAEGIQNIGPAIETMADAEGLFAHKNAVSIRLNALQNG